MSDSDEAVGHGGPPPIVGEPPGMEVDPPARRGRKRGPTICRPTEGNVAIFLIIMSTTGFWHDTFTKRAMMQQSGMPGALANQIFDNVIVAHGDVLVGAVLGRWRIVTGMPPEGTHANMIWKRFKNIAGFLSYDVLDHQASRFTLDDLHHVVDLRPWIIEEQVAAAMGTSSTGDNLSFAQWREQVKQFGEFLPIVVARVCPALALAVVGGLFAVLHWAPLSPNRVSRKHVLKQAPIRAHLQDIAKGLQPRQLCPRREGRPREGRRQLESEMPAAVIIEWLDATSEIRSLKRAQEAVDKFGQIIARHNNLPRRTLLRGLKAAPYKALCRGRVKLDTTIMLLWRQYWQQSDMSKISLHLWIDSSPQRRGLEFLAASFDLCRQGQVVKRRLLPALSLARQMWDVFGKTLALLYQIWLIAGPKPDAMRAVLRSIRSLTTDMGVEASICHQRDCLREFLQEVGLTIPRGFTDEEWLFPNCLQVAGWKHKIDILIKRGLSSCSFFPNWLTKTKAVVSFMRDESNRQVLVDDLEQRHLDGLAGILRDASMPTFAAWRWGTLARVCRELSLWIASFAQHFRPELFRKTRDPERLKSVCAALQPDWMVQFKFVEWFMKFMDQLQQYGATCGCHRREYENGEDLNSKRSDWLAKVGPPSNITTIFLICHC